MRPAWKRAVDVLALVLVGGTASGWTMNFLIDPRRSHDDAFVGLDIAIVVAGWLWFAYLLKAVVFLWKQHRRFKVRAAASSGPELGQRSLR